MLMVVLQNPADVYRPVDVFMKFLHSSPCVRVCVCGLPLWDKPRAKTRGFQSFRQRHPFAITVTGAGVREGGMPRNL